MLRGRGEVHGYPDPRNLPRLSLSYTCQAVFICVIIHDMHSLATTTRETGRMGPNAAISNFTFAVRLHQTRKYSAKFQIDWGGI